MSQTKPDRSRAPATTALFCPRSGRAFGPVPRAGTGAPRSRPGEVAGVQAICLHPEAHSPPFGQSVDQLPSRQLKEALLRPPDAISPLNAAGTRRHRSSPSSRTVGRSKPPIATVPMMKPRGVFLGRIGAKYVTRKDSISSSKKWRVRTYVILSVSLVLIIAGFFTYRALRPFNLQAAIDAASVGATITIPSGTHTGPFYVRKALTLKGTSASVLTANGDNILRIEGCSGVVLDGFTVKGVYANGSQLGVNLINVSSVTIRNLRVSDCGYAGIYANSTISSVTVSDCTITHCGDFGIHFHGTWNGVTISRVTASGFAGLHYPSHAIYLKGEVSGKNFTIQDCDLGNSYGPGGGVSAICVGYGVTNGQILRNKVHTSPFGICLWGRTEGPTTGITCSGNVGSNNSEADFYEYGPNIQATWTSDNVGTLRKVLQ